MKYSVEDALARRKKAIQERSSRLIERWAAQAQQHEHQPLTVTAPADEGRNGTALDEITESRCACGQLMGFVS